MNRLNHVYTKKINKPVKVEINVEKEEVKKEIQEASNRYPIVSKGIKQIQKIYFLRDIEERNGYSCDFCEKLLNIKIIYIDT